MYWYIFQGMVLVVWCLVVRFTTVVSSFYRPLLHNAGGNVRFYLVVWLFSKRPLSISLGINCLCMHYTNTKVCRSLLSWNHARNPIEDDLHYSVFKKILSQKMVKTQKHIYFTHFQLFVYQTFKSVISETQLFTCSKNCLGHPVL